MPRNQDSEGGEVMATSEAMTVVNVRKLNKDHTITVSVHVTKELKVRLWIATALMKAAAWVLDCGIAIVDEEGEDDASIK